MGQIKETKLDNGMIGLEITYGGNDAPFGGIDTSAAPMYIDPSCFALANGFLVIEKQLVACGWLSAGVTLQGWVTGSQYLASGTFFQGGTNYNFVLASSSAGGAGPPVYEQVTYYIWIWNPVLPIAPVSVPLTAQCTVDQYAVQNNVNTGQATGYVQVFTPPGVTASATAMTYKITVGAGAQLTIAISIGDTPAVIATNIAAAINGAASYPCTAAIDPSNSNNVILTAVATGPLTLPIQTVLSGTSFSNVTITTQDIGGLPSVNSFNFSPSINPVSWVSVGETIYFSGFGAVILAFGSVFSDTPQFRPITQYLGANVLGKFNGQLIAVGVTPGPGTYIQDAEMVIAWSASNALGVWNPENGDGTVTGAGFNQIDDISDYLTGMFINSGTAVILRTQGIDYITPLSGGVVPFDFAHISNAMRGEGCQDSRLQTQYDQVGFFVGNADVFQFAGSLSAIGQKIKNLLIPSMGPTIENRKAVTGLFLSSNGNVEVFLFILIDYKLFVYCPSNGTWMEFGFTNNGQLLDVGFWSAFGTAVSGSAAEEKQFNTYMQPILVQYETGEEAAAPTFWYLNQTIQNVDYANATTPQINFPVEEVAFGRDIVIQGLLINCTGVEGQVIDFEVFGTLSTRDGGGAATPITGNLTLPAGATFGVYQNYQVYFENGSQDKMMVQNPQLQLSLPLLGSGAANPFICAKIALFGSFDPNQEPV